MWKNFGILVVLLFTIGNQIATAKGGSQTISIHDAWVREAPPTSKILAAYMVIENTGNQLRILTGATSPFFEKVEIHQSMMHAGMFHMQQLEKIEVAPHKSVVFKSGGYHLMLIGGQAPLRVGDQVELMLGFDNGEKMRVSAAVRKAATNGGAHQQMDHSHPTGQGKKIDE